MKENIKKYIGTVNPFQWAVLIIYVMYMVWLTGTTKRSLERKEVKDETPKDPYEEFDKMFE